MPFERTITFSRSSSLANSVSPASSPTSAADGALIDLHHPAAGQSSFGLQVDRAGFLEHLEGAGPELQPQDVAFPREQVIIDVEPRHRPQMAADDAFGDERRNLRRWVAAVFDVMQRGGTDLQPLLVAGDTTP